MIVRLQFRFLLLLSLCGCQSKIPNKNVDDDLVLRQRAFLEELYLPNTVAWLNFSDAMECQRESDWLYLNFTEVQKKTGLDYFQLINLQYQLNTLWFSKRPYLLPSPDKTYTSSLRPSDRLVLFEQALELVNGGVTFWTKPEQTYSVWVIDWDSVSKDQRTTFLTRLLQLPEIKDVLPIILSRCSSSVSIKKELETQPELLAFSNVLGVEVLTAFPYPLTGDLHSFHHPLEAYFPTGTTLTWVRPEDFSQKTRNNRLVFGSKEYKVIYR